MAALAAMVLFAGCANNQEGGTVVGAITGGIIGNQFGKGGGKVASTLAGAVVGGIVGNEIGRSLDQRDRELARQAEYDAWETGPPRPAGALAQSQQRPLRRGHRRGLLRPRWLALPQLPAPRLHRRPRADHARHRLPQPRRHLDPSRLKPAGGVRPSGSDTVPLAILSHPSLPPRPSRPLLRRAEQTAHLIAITYLSRVLGPLDPAWFAAWFVILFSLRACG